MGLSINNNIAALNSYRNLSSTQNDLSKSLEKLSSGLRINRAADDAAGLAISEGLRAQIGGTKQAVRNAQDGISVVQTAEGALTETHSILQRMRTLAVQASNDGGLSTNAKQNIQDEIGQLQTELTRISDTTQFNGKKLLDGKYSGVFQVGANTSAQDQITVSIQTKNAAGLGALGLGVDKLDVTKAGATLTASTAGTDGSGVTGSATTATYSSTAADLDALGAEFGLSGTYATAADLEAVLVGSGSTATVGGSTGAYTVSFANTANGTGGITYGAGVTAPGSVATTPGVADVAGGPAAAATGTVTVAGDAVAGNINYTDAAGTVTSVDLATVAAGWTDATSDADKLTSLNTALAAVGGTATATADGFSIALTATAAGAGSFSVSGSENAGALSAVDAIDAAITEVSSVRSQLGAVQNRFDHTINNLNVAVENLSASESRIRDTDMAQEMVAFTRSQILSQAGTAMLAQAKSLPQSVLQLLQ